MPADSNRVKELFVAALELAEADRRAFLDRECIDDPDLRRRLDALLQAHDQPESALERPLAGEAQTGMYGKAVESPGVVIAGRYKLLESIGEGGMGEVWVAEQTQPVRRKVALKLIKAGMDSKSVLARFEAERQALAMMDHPNIAKVLDGGLTEAGRPFFVMEYVKGVPITEFCDAARLDVKQRLELFTQVCHAVQHAHQKGIIHRDLKPSNILVAPYDDRPVPKVIDFGLAKAMHQALTERTLHTAHETVLGTPLYMSPEQAQLNNLDVDTRSDVYSLGVLLYELLTGTTPLELQRLKQAAWDEIRRIIREEEPPRPSTRLSSTDTLASLAACRQTEPAKLTKLVRGEIDWIVMKALEKDRNRRYETANALAGDIQRYLADEEVEARPPTPGYRLRKLVRRNRGRVVAAALVLLVLLGGLVGTSFGLVEARRQERRALDERDDKERARLAEAEERKQAETARNAEAEQRQVAQTAFERAEASLYFNRIALADRYWSASNVGRANQILDACPEQLRHWEWYHLKQREHQELVTVEGDQVAYSPDGDRLATDGKDNSVQIRDARTGRVLVVLQGDSPSAFSRIAFSPDGRRLAAACQDRTIKVWDIGTGKIELKLKVKSQYPVDIAYSRDGQRIACGGAKSDPVHGGIMPGHLQVWNATTGEECFSLPEAGKAVAFSPDGSRLVTMSRGTLKPNVPFEPGMLVLDAKSGAVIRKIPGRGLDDVAMAFAPDGKTFASARDDEIKFWNLASGAELRTLRGHTGRVTSLAFSRDGNRLVSGATDESLRVWNLKQAGEVFKFRGHRGAVGSVDFSPDGRHVASGGADETVRIWDATSPPGAQEIPGTGNINDQVAISADGRRLARVHFLPLEMRLPLYCFFRVSISHLMTLSIVNARTGQLVRILSASRQEPEAALAFSGDGRWLAMSCGKEVRVWDVDNGSEVARLPGGKTASFNRALEFSGDGRRLAFVGSARSVEIWDISEQRRLLTLSGPVTYVHRLAFSPDGSRIASVGTGRPNQGLFQPGEVKVWDAATGQIIFDLKGHTLPVHGVTFSRDGKHLVTASWDQTARAWDLETGKAEHVFRGHTSYVWDVAFSADGKRLVTAGYDAIKLWDWASRDEILSLEGSGTLVGFSDRDTRLYAANRRGLRFWNNTAPRIVGK